MSIEATFRNDSIDVTFGNDDIDISVGEQIVRDATIISNLPTGGLPGDILVKQSDADYAVEWVTPANRAESDNTRPITSAGVYLEIGNINALLAII